MKDHGFMDIAPCDIMDEDGEMDIPVINGSLLQGKNYVGKNLANYKSMLVLSHFKGHQMGGFGGALKNMSIGIASREGKAWIHTVGITKNTKEILLVQVLDYQLLKIYLKMKTIKKCL